MSTEHQQYSTENQSEAMRQYAERRGIEIVRSYADEGRSGLRLDGRDALKQLIEDVQSGTADFTVILVYDVSRWGRFQDAAESAYYKYICKRAGNAVIYFAEPSAIGRASWREQVCTYERVPVGALDFQKNQK